MLKQKTAGVMIFHPLRLRLLTDMSTCEIFYSTQSNNIVCFQIDLILTCLIRTLALIQDISLRIKMVIHVDQKQCLSPT